MNTLLLQAMVNVFGEWVVWRPRDRVPVEPVSRPGGCVCDFLFLLFKPMAFAGEFFAIAVGEARILQGLDCRVHLMIGNNKVDKLSQVNHRVTYVSGTYFIP